MMLAEVLYEDELREQYEKWYEEGERQTDTKDEDADLDRVTPIQVIMAIPGLIVSIIANVIGLIAAFICGAISIIAIITAFILSLLLMGGIMLLIFYWIPKWIFMAVFGIF